MQKIEDYAGKVVNKLKQVTYLRDVQIAQPLKFPVVTISLDHLKAAQPGLDVQDIARSVTASTSSSRSPKRINGWMKKKLTPIKYRFRYRNTS